MGMDSGAQRERYWNEKDTEQKLEQLLDAVFVLSEGLLKMSGFVEKLLKHQHGEGGKILTPMPNPNEESYGSIVHTPYWMRKKFRGETKRAESGSTEIIAP